jgi:hypothetical protein
LRGSANPIDGAAFTQCTSPYTTPKLSLAQHTIEVRAVNATGVADPTPAAFTFRVARTRVEVRRTACTHAEGALGLVDASKDRRLRFRCSGRCQITATIQRHVTELGAASVDGASLLVYAPAAGSVLVAGKAIKSARATAKSAGAVRVGLKRAGGRAGTAKLTIAFSPDSGPALTSSATVKLKRAAAKRRARTRA